MDEYVKLLTYLAGPAIVALVTAIVFLWREISDLKLHISENYVKQTTLNTIHNDTKEMKSVLYEIAAKVGVSIQRPF